MKVQVKDKQGIDEAGNKHPAPGITDGPHECELKWQWKDTIRGDWSILLGSHLDNKGNPTSFVTDDFPTRQIWVLAEQEKQNMSLKKSAIIESEFRHLFDFKDEVEEDNHNASMLMFKFLTEVENVTDVRKISRKKLAESIGTSASNITQLFRGNRLINLLTLAKLERVLDIEFQISSRNLSEKKTEVNTPFIVSFEPFDMSTHFNTNNIESTRIAELSARVAELEGVLKEINKELFTWVIDSNPIKFEHYQKASELATNALKNQQP